MKNHMPEKVKKIEKKNPIVVVAETLLFYALIFAFVYLVTVVTK